MATLGRRREREGGVRRHPAARPSSLPGKTKAAWRSPGLPGVEAAQPCAWQRVVPEQGCRAFASNKRDGVLVWPLGGGACSSPQCARYAGDPDNVVLVGQSAGGQLGALALLKQVRRARVVRAGQGGHWYGGEAVRDAGLMPGLQPDARPRPHCQGGCCSNTGARPPKKLAFRNTLPHPGLQGHPPSP